MRYVEFKFVAIGQGFALNGNEYVKQSRRTARLVEYNRVFYIGMTELVTAKTI